MAASIFVNLPVRDLEASKAFYTRLGFTLNPQFSDDTAACMVVSDTIYVMLLTHAKFAEFTSLPVADAKATTQVLLALNYVDRAEMDGVVEAGLAAGGTEARPPQDMGFMASRAVADLDGHIWEIVWMDPNGMPQ